jgi:hypothetical protein
MSAAVNNLEPTASGKPCNMKKGHPARFHRHREYPELKWTMKNGVGKQVAHGVGINPLTTAISSWRVKGVKLLIEVEC